MRKHSRDTKTRRNEQCTKNEFRTFSSWLPSYLRVFVSILFPLIAGCATNHPAAGTPAARDPEIAEMLVEIDPQRIHADIQKLVSFKTRHTLSDTEGKTEGIGAARNWIKSEFEKYAADSNG